MTALIGEHFTVLRRPAKGDSMLVCNKIVISPVDYEDRTGVRLDNSKIVKRVQHNEAGRQKTRRTCPDTDKTG